MTRSIELLEVGPRDGLQMEPEVVPTAVKADLIERLLRAGLKRIEVTSFVNPKKVPQMADAEELLSRLKRPEGVFFTGLVLNRKGLERAIAAGCNEIGMVVVASDTFNRRNQGVGTEDSIAAWIDIAERARRAGIRAQVTVSAAFGCPFEGDVPLSRVLDIARRVA